MEPRKLCCLVLLGLALIACGCDPIVNVYGSFLPGWIICIAAGITITALFRWLFAVVRLERHLGPLVLVYPALAFLLSCVAWLIWFGP